MMTHPDTTLSTDPGEVLHDMINALSTAQGLLRLILRDPSLSQQTREDLEAAFSSLQEAIVGARTLTDTLNQE